MSPQSALTRVKASCHRKTSEKIKVTPAYVTKGRCRVSGDSGGGNGCERGPVTIQDGLVVSDKDYQQMYRVDMRTAAIGL